MARQMKIQAYEAVAHEYIGHFEGLPKEKYKLRIKHYREAIKIYEYMGDTGAAKIAEGNIARIKLQHGGTGPESLGKVRLKTRKDLHEQFVWGKGERSVNATQTGVNLAGTLSQLGHAIESERLLTKQMRLSLKIHGREHDITKQVKLSLEIVKQRKETIPSQPGVEFEALRHEVAGDKYIVRRASHRVINKSGGVSPGSTKGEIFAIASKDILWREGTPVVCHGSKKASHLNGKIGDARSYNYGTSCYGVHFEHASKPVAVKKENLRIVFEFLH